MPNGVGATVDAMKPSCLGRTSDRFLGVAESRKLRERHDAMLFPCERCELMVTSPFRVHMDY